MLAQVTEEMVRLYKEQFGRGPTTARTDFAGPNALICTLENTLTPAERNLAQMDEHQRLRDTRIFFQYASTGEFTEVVERLTGRRVRAFVSGIDTAKVPAAKGLRVAIASETLQYPEGEGIRGSPERG